MSIKISGCAFGRFHQRCFGHGSSIRRNFASSARLASNVTLSYSEYGPETVVKDKISPVLMTHGLLGAKQNWNTIAKAVARLTTRKVITFDARNHGESPHSDEMNYEVMCEDILDLTDRLGIQKFILLGHSMGGRTAMAFALRYPKRISKLVVVDISPLSVGGDFDLMRNYLEALNSMKFDTVKTLSEARKYADAELKALVPELGIRAFLITNLAIDSNNRIYWKPNLPVLLKNLAIIKQFPQDLLSLQIITPTLFIRGETSPYVPKEEFDGIRRIFPNVKFSTIKNAGHWPHADNSTAFMENLTQFLYKQ